ncbi:MAG: 2-oxoacid:acceptor oxidoreductase family protein [Bacillota bacterium]|jgi:2-oxoglutarate ferredoxin oxidoreductase subunit gamma
MGRLWEFRLSGTGGQGIIKAAVLLAQAALYDGFDATQSQVYGPESRGGSSKGEVVIDHNEILYPKVIKPNFLLCLSQQAYDKFVTDIRPDGILLVDQHFCKVDGKVPEGVRVYSLPIIDAANNVLKNHLSANVVSLGAIIGLTNVVSMEAAKESLKDNFKAKLVPMNIDALEYGYKMADEVLHGEERKIEKIEKKKKIKESKKKEVHQN